MILIISDPLDAHADRVQERLEALGAKFVRFDVASFPRGAAATCRIPARAGPEFRISVLQGGERHDLEGVDAVWNRRPKRPVVADGMNAVDRDFARSESEQLITGAWRLLADRFWLNPLPKARAAESKILQLARAKSQGLRVPDTIITNDPAEACAFAERGQIAYKTLAFLERPPSNGRYHAVYTNIVTRADLASRAKSIALAPCLLQEYIPKRVEIRATVVGGEVFAAEIDSQQSERSKVDWRRYDFENVAYRKHDLPDDVAEKLLRTLGRLGLVFGCFDLILTPEGEYVFLEVNQAGQWYWIEILTGLPITDCVARLLRTAGKVAKGAPAIA